MAQEFDLLSTLAATSGGPAASAAPAPAEDPTVADYRRLFSDAPPEQLDPDTMGLVTEAEGRRLGTGWDRGTVRALNIYGETVTYEKLQELEGGRQLTDLASRARGGRRDFLEAVGTGSITDFIPYVGDLASWGVSIRNMKTVRDGFKKMAKDGPQSLTLQEKVLMKMHEEDMRRQSEQTWGATVGSIVRQAPAFAAEFALTGGAFKLGAKALGMAGREAVEDVVVSGARRQAAKLATEALTQPGMAKEGLELAKLAGFDKWLDDFVAAGVKNAGGTLDDLGVAALKARGVKAAELAVAAKRNPSLIRDLGDFAVEYGKRGVFDHLDNVVRDMPPSVLGKLREAAGVAFIEAPVKGGLYAAFDFLAVNPLAAAAAGADEAVTETEVGISMSGDEELMKNAKMLAFGTAWAEYASESSGRAFNALGGIVTDNVAGTVGRSVATRGLRATQDFKSEGSLARRMIDALTGKAEDLKPALAKLRRETVEMAAAGDRLGGKTVNEFMLSDAAGVERLVKERLGFQEKSFIGYYIASKALEKDITPQAVNKLLEAMGYDDILGEFMEERYNGFAQGLFGLDGTSEEHMGVMRRLAHAAQASTVDFKQGSAEIMAFALPVVGRATIAKAYTVLDAGKIGKFKAVSQAISDLRSLGGWTHFADGAAPVNAEIEMSDEGTGSALEIQRQKTGRDRLKQENAWKLESMDRAAQTLVDAIKDYGDIAEDRSGIGVKAARAALGIANAIITGNPLMAFNNPAKAVMLEGLGQEGVKLLQTVAGLRRSAYAAELGLRAGTSADAARKALAESGAETSFDDPEIEAAIRPGLVATARELIRIGLRSQGALVTTGADVDAHMEKVSEKEIAEAGGREAYRAAFEAKLPDAAKRLRFDVQGDSAMLAYERALSTDDTVSAMDRQVESFLDQMGAASVADLTNADDPSREYRAFAGVPMRESEMALTAGIGMDTKDPAVRQSVRQARMRLALEIFRNPNFANELSRERLFERAGDYARLLIEVKRDLLRPQFDAPATDTPGLDGERVEIKGADGAYYAAYAKSGRKVSPVSYLTLADAEASALAMGMTKRDTPISFTPSLASFIPYAAMLLSPSVPGAAGYIKKSSEAAKRSHALNPFYNAANTHAQARRIVDAERVLAKRWLDRKSTPFATAEEEAAAEQTYRKVFGVAGRDGFVSASGEELDGYETAAAKLASLLKLDLRQNPARRGQSGYVLNPAGASYDGQVYIPYRYAGSTAALIEEGVEDAIKRNEVRQGDIVLSGFFRDPVDPSRYSPAAKAFMTVVLTELQKLKDSSAATKDTKAEIALLENIFNPAEYEIEAVSHAIGAFYFMQGDAADLGLGGGAAFYATLGLIAKQVRANREEYDAFGQTVNRLLGGGKLEIDGSRLRQAVGSFVPRRFQDDTKALRTESPGESPFTPLTDIRRMAEDLDIYVKNAKAGKIRATGKRREDEGTPASAVETARYKALLAQAQSLARGGYFDEDLPALLDTLAAKNEKELADLGYDVAKLYSPALDVAEASKAIEDAKRARALANSPGVTNSWGEEVMVSDPAFALRLGAEFAKRRPAMPGDRRSVLRKIFDEFRSRDPLLPESLYARFTQAVKDAGLYVEGEKAKDITAEVSKGAMTLDASFLEMPADTDDEDTGGELTDADGDTDSRDDGGAYSEEAVKMLLEKSGPVQLLLNLMNFYSPGMNHHSPSVMRIFADASEALYEAAPDAEPSDALMSVFDYSKWTEKSGTSHPALLDAEAFEAWLDKPRPEDGKPMFDDLRDAFRALGVEGVFSAADKLKGSYGMDMMTAETQTDSDARAKSAKFTRRAQTLSGDVAESLTQGAMKSTKEKAREALALLMAETPGTAGFEGRIDRLAQAADLMFGENNAFSQALLHHPTRTRIEAAVSRLGTPQATKADAQTGKMFAEVPGKAYGKAGMVAGQLAKAAELLGKGETGRAVLTLMRGDVLEMAALRNGAKSNWDRGGVTAELNAAAGGNPVGLSSRLDDATRGTAKVRSLAAEQSVGSAEFLLSDVFEKAAKAVYDTVKTAIPFKKLLARARRYAEWPDGTPVFSSFAGLTRKLEKASGEYDPYDDFSAPVESGDESFRAAGMSAFERVGQPTYEELSDIARLDYDAGKSGIATIPVYNSEKTAERLVRVPRSALAALTGKASPTFDEARKTLSKLLLIEDVSAKRGFVWMSEGPSVTIPNAKLGLIVAEDAAARENYHGELFVTLSDLADYYRRQGFVATAKHIFTHAPGRASMTLASKGQMILADGKYEPGSQTAAFMDIARIGQELGLTALTDLDSYKEGPLVYKAADGRKAYELMLSGETDAEVKGPKGAMKVSEIMTAQGVTLENETINGGKVMIVSFAPGGVRSQWASAPGKKAKPVDSEMPVDKIMNNPAIQTFLNAQAKLRRAFAGRADVERDLKAKAIGKLPDAAKRLLEAGVSEYDPQIRAVLGPKLAAASAKAVKPTYRNIQAVAQNHDGARIIEKDGKPVLSDPFGGMKALPGGLIHDAYESEELGVRVAASTAANIGHGTARYGLRVIPAKLGVKDGDNAGIMRELERRVTALKAAERESQLKGDDGIFLAAYKELVADCFTNHLGAPLQPGQILSFSDFVDGDGGFDRSRVKHVNEGENKFTFLGGQLGLGSRTPADKGRRGEYFFSTAMPAYMEPADGSQTYRAISTREDGTLFAETVPYPVGTLVAGSAAVVKITPWAKYLAGSDEDWDRLAFGLLTTDSLGRAAAPIDAEKAEAAVASATGADILRKIAAKFAKRLEKAAPELREKIAAQRDEALAKAAADAPMREAQSILDGAVAGLQVKSFNAQVAFHRSLGYQPMTNPVKATPLSKKAQDALPAYKSPALGDEGMATKAMQNKDAGKARGISTAVVASYKALIDNGISFVKGLGNVSVLAKPEGAKSAFWARGFVVGNAVAWSMERLNAVVEVVEGIKNATFDDMKEALAYRAGFRPEFLDLHIALAFDCGVGSQEEYDQFHAAFLEWISGTHGAAVSQAFANARYPGRYGGAKYRAGIVKATKSMLDAARAEEDKGKGAPYRYRVVRELKPQQQAAVAAVIDTEMGKGFDAAFDAAFPMASAFARLNSVQALGRVLMYKKASFSYPGQVTSAERISEKVNALRDTSGTDKARIQFRDDVGLRNMYEAIREFDAVVAAAKRASAGTVEMSELYATAADYKLTEAPKSLGDLKIDQRDAALRAANMLLPWEAAAMATPAETGAKIDAYLAAVNGKTPAFLGLVEALHVELFREYAKSLGKGGPSNAALDAILTPSVESKAKRITLTGTDGTAAGKAAMREGMLALLNGTSKLPAVAIRTPMVDAYAPRQTFEFTTADIYWMTLQYVALTAEKTMETGRSQQSLLDALFGPEVYKTLSDWQVEQLKSTENAERLLNWVSAETSHPSSQGAVRREGDLVVPAAFENGQVQWGALEVATRKAASENAKVEAELEPTEQVPEFAVAMDTAKAEAMEIPAPADPAAAPAGFQGYKGGFDNFGKGSAQGDGKDKAMRKVMTSAKVPGFIGEIANTDKGSSTRTSLLEAASYGSGGNVTKTAPGSTHSSLPMFMGSGKYATGEFKVMLARNGEFGGRPLAQTTVDSVKAAAKAGASFVVGDMPGVDSQFVDLLQAIGAPFEVYHTGSAPRFTVADGKPAMSRPAEIRKQLQAYAKSVASAPAEARGLTKVSVHGRRYLAQATDATRKQAEAMGFALTRAAELPWVAAVPSAVDSLTAASGILEDLGYAEPAVFLGALRAAGRAAVASNAKDSVDVLRQILTDAGAAQSVDMDRLTAAQKSGAELLAKPARQRVMEFAVISEPGFRGGADTAAVAQGLLKAIETEGTVSDRGVSTFSLAEPAFLTEAKRIRDARVSGLENKLPDLVSFSHHSSFVNPQQTALVTIRRVGVDWIVDTVAGTSGLYAGQMLDVNVLDLIDSIARNEAWRADRLFPQSLSPAIVDALAELHRIDEEYDARLESLYPGKRAEESDAASELGLSFGRYGRVTTDPVEIWRNAAARLEKRNAGSSPLAAFLRAAAAAGWCPRIELHYMKPGWLGDKSASGFASTQNGIGLMPDAFLDADWLTQVLAHELVHVVTQDQLLNDGTFRSRIERMMQRAKTAAAGGAYSGEYGFTNAHEFVAEAFTNRRFQKFLAGLPSRSTEKNTDGSLWAELKAAIKALVSSVLPSAKRSMLDAVVDTTLEFGAEGFASAAARSTPQGAVLVEGETYFAPVKEQDPLPSPDPRRAVDARVPVESMMGEDDRKLAAIAVDSAVGYVPQREAPTFSFGVPEIIDVVNRAEAEILGLTKGDFELSDYAREWRKTHGPKGDVRKVFHKPESLAILTPLFFRADKNALRGVADYLRQQIGVIENSRHLGQELKGALVRPLGLFFKPGSAYAELIALGKLPHSRGRLNADGTRGMSYRALIKAVGIEASTAVAELKKSLDVIGKLTGPAREAADAEFLKAETAFLTAVHLARVSAVALRPRTELLDADGKPVLGENGRPVHIDNPLRAEMQALENESFEPPKDAEPQPPPTPEEINTINPEHGHVDPWNDFNITFTTSQAWFDSTVFPDFRGADVRGILFNKESAAALTRVTAFTNGKEALWGMDSDTGALRIIERIKGMKGDDAVKYLRRTLPQEEADILAGRGFTDDEYDLVHYMTQAIHHYNGDGGERARIATAGDMRFSDLAWDTLRKMTAEEVRVFASYDEAARRRNSGGEAQVKAVHDLLLRAKEILPAALYPRAETEVALALIAGRFAEDPAQAVLKDLESKGYAVARPETSATGAVRLTDAVLSVPVTLVDEVFQGLGDAPSSAKAKLLAAGRLESELTLRGNAAEFKREYDLLYKTFGSMGWLVNGDARMFTDIGTAAPSMVGTGSHRYHARKLKKAATPEYSARVAELYEGLKRSSGSFSAREQDADGQWVSREKTGAEAAADGRHNGMFLFLRQLRPATFSSASESAAEIWEVIRRGAAKDIGLDENSTGWEIAKAVYRLSVAKVHEVAWAGGTVESSAIDTAGLEAFNRLIGEQSEERGEGVMPGATFSDVYAVTGALQQNLTAGQALAAHARQLAEAIRYRGAVNQMLMTPDENGMPLIVAKPGADDGDDTVPNRIWASVARWWAESYADKDGGGVYYDESKSGRDNARRLYDQIVPGKTAEGGEAEAVRGARRYVWTDVRVPPGMPTFEAVAAAKDPAGDDTRSRMNAHGGGEAANIARQIFAIAGYGREDTKNTKINHILSWSKSASVMCSLFFPIATAFESPVAAVGMGSTLLGLTQTGADFARWAQKNNGWIAKALGVKDLEGAPFMADILRVIGSDDPALVQLKMEAQMAGLSLADRSRNMLDTDRTLIAKDIKAASDRVRAIYGAKAAASVKALLEGAMEHSSEFAFEYVINATKLAVFSQMSARLRQKALAAGRWWDPVRDMKKWAPYINSEVGGIDPAMYPWMTPAMQQWLRMAMFSWEWTLGAWEAGGGGALTQKLFGRTTNAATRKFMFGRWARMYFGVMVGIPVGMQMLLTGIAKAAGEGDDDDKWLTLRNESGKGHDFDITPLLRMIADAPAVPAFGAVAGLAGLISSPLAGFAAGGAAAALTAATGFAGKTVGDVKKALPESVAGLPVGALLPGATGQEGEMVSTRRRRYYMHLGKQGWEVAGWFENPTRSFLSKMSMPVQKVMEGVLGITPSMGWDKDWKDLGFWERWTSLDPEKSALLNLTQAFVPFSVMGAQRSPEVGAIAALGPVGKGMSKTRAEKEMAAMFAEWGDAETYVAKHKARPGAYTDLASMATEWLEALRLNGYPPETSLKNALAAARKPLYERVHKALPYAPGMKPDTAELEAAARGLYRLDFVGKNLLKSIKSRDKNQNVKRVDDLARVTDEALKSAFSDPYGRRTPEAARDRRDADRLKRSAALGGDVSSLLGNDKAPATVLGYRVMRTEELSADDLRFFSENPDSAGHFEKEAK